MKKWMMMFVLTIFLCGMHVSAEENQTVVALGADLSASQRSTVLEYMGLSEEDLASCKVITITNEEEHRYLDAYLDQSVIGTKSLTSVKIAKAEPGSGVQVTTRNVNYCTTGMYRNALITAGVEDVEVLVVAPSPISGTAGLIGTIKAYEQSENTVIAENVIDTALAELITTGELEKLAGEVSNEDIEALMAWLKAKLASGELDTSDENSMKNVIGQGEKEFGVSLDENEKNQIISVLKKLDKLGIDGKYLFNEAEKILNKYGSDIMNHTGEAIKDANQAINQAAKEAATGAVKGFIKNIGDSVKDFFSKIFKK